ncbi:MAG: YeeE/YedE family protein [Alphaproteobacteria bacterium]|nr:YeeE/YedE family protein [Pseudomonadota bacterium]TDI63756.1 MAG: YeeE/YedE family protein [Alphaproteobacteria bacterium]
MENFTPLSALAGGALMGLGAVVLLWLTGRIAGVSGIIAGLLPPGRGDALWRLAFLVGLVGGAAIYRTLGGPLQVLQFTMSTFMIVIGGLLVGLGAGLAGGCTSGHGICGVARASKRSLLALSVFILAAGLTIYLIRHVLRGG